MCCGLDTCVGKLICTRLFKQNCMFAQTATLQQSRSAQRPAGKQHAAAAAAAAVQRRRPPAAESQQSRLRRLPQTFPQARYNRDCDIQPTSGLNKRACGKRKLLVVTRTPRKRGCTFGCGNHGCQKPACMIVTTITSGHKQTPGFHRRL